MARANPLLPCKGFGGATNRAVPLGLGRIVALYHLLIHFIAESLNVLGTAFSEAKMRPDPCQGVRAGGASRAHAALYLQ
jgi:hypothetical protein